MPSSNAAFDHAKIVLKALLEAGYNSMFAGGCVRDRLLKIKPKDYDIATCALPEQCRDLFTAHGYRVIPTGISHGTMTVVTASGPVEVTTLRKDLETDGRHATVEFHGATFKTDAQRRDFTINALYEDDSGTIHDFCGGLQDLKDKRLRFVGDATARIKEDYLRILRFFRFWARFDFNPDESALLAISSEATGLKKISQERITAELWGILSGPFSASAITSMLGLDVMRFVISESISISPSLPIILLDGQSSAERLRPWIQLGILLGITQGRGWTKKQVQAFTKRLRFSEKQTKLLVDIIIGWQSLASLPRRTSAALNFAANIERHGSEYSLLEFFSPIWSFFGRHSQGAPSLEALSWLVAMDVTFGERRHQTMPVTGNDLLKVLPHLKGAEIGDMMEKLKCAFYDGEWTGKDQALDFIIHLQKQKLEETKPQ
jgi:tRNA nucleotidyltransferase/poly(A) polymerase